MEMLAKGVSELGKVQQLCLFGLPEIPISERRVSKRKDVIKHESIKHELLLIPKISIHPNQINIYNEVHWEPFKPVRNTETEDSTESKPVFAHLLESSRSAEGRVSAIARRKMMRALDYMLLITNQKTAQGNFLGRIFKFKIAFVTLTLPSKQIHTDNEIKSLCLNQLLIELKRVYKVKNYIWRAEKQVNGNIHFHILVDKFVPYQELRDRWNRIVDKLGYVQRYREEQRNWHKNGFRLRINLLPTWPKEKQLAAYKRGAKTQWNSPNSTDVHSITKVNNIKAYISKYITKDRIDNSQLSFEEFEQLSNSGRIWGCNKELSNIKGAVSVVDSEIQKEVEFIENELKANKFSDTYFKVLFINLEMLQTGNTPQLFRLFCQFLLDKFQYNYQVSLAT